MYDETPDVAALIEALEPGAVAPPKVQSIPLAALRFTTPAENPNRMDPEDFRLLTLAIGTHGFNQPILVRPLPPGRSDMTTHEIVDGNHRSRAALELGFEEVPAVVRDLTDAQVKGLRLAMNRLRGRLDLTMARAAVRDLAADGLTMGELLVTGFGVEDLAGFLENEAPPTPSHREVTVSDDTPAMPKPFTLEIQFTEKRQYQLCLRKLRKAAGRSQDLGAGLLNVLGELSPAKGGVR